MAIDLSVGEQFIREVVVSSTEGVLVVVPPGDVVFANGAVRDLLGYERGELTGRRFTDVCPDGDLVDTIRAAAETGRERGGSDGRSAPLEGSLRSADGDRVPVELRAETTRFDQQRYVTLRVRERPGAGESTSALPGAVDADRAHEPSLEAFAEVSRDLSAATTVDEVADVTLAGAERLFGSDLACVRLLDEEANRLERVATTDRAAELVAGRPAFDLDATLAGRALRQGQPVVGSPTDVDDGGAGRDGLHVPLGDRGAVTVYLSPGSAVGESDRARAALYGAVATAALERVAGGDDTDGPDAGDYAVHRAMEDLGGTIHDTIGAVLRADTEREIKERVCDGLSVASAFSRVWVAETDVDDGWTVVAASPGTPGRDGGTAPPNLDTIERAVATGEPTTTTTTTTTAADPGDAPAERGATGQTVAVPIAHGGRTYGVFVVEGSGSPPLVPFVQSSLETFGHIAGFAVSAVENRKLFLSEERIELEFEVTGPDCLAVPVSEACDCHCEITHNTLTSDGDHLLYLEADDADPGTVVEAAAGVESVTDCRVVDADGEGCLVEVIKTESGADGMLDFGATVVRAEAESGTGTLVVEAPTDVDAHALADAYTARNPDSHLVAKRVVDQPVDVSPSVRDDLESLLTDKQQAALETAYHAGYYRWPRESTAEEVASSLGVSPPTLHQHLRKAVGTLLEHELDG